MDNQIPTPPPYAQRGLDAEERAEHLRNSLGVGPYYSSRILATIDAAVADSEAASGTVIDKLRAELAEQIRRNDELYLQGSAQRNEQLRAELERARKEHESTRELLGGSRRQVARLETEKDALRARLEQHREAWKKQQIRQDRAAGRITEIVDALEREESRGQGQTTRLAQLAIERRACLLVHHEGYARQLRQQWAGNVRGPEVRTIQQAADGFLRGVRRPIFLDHHAAVYLLREAAEELRSKPAFMGVPASEYRSLLDVAQEMLDRPYLPITPLRPRFRLDLDKVQAEANATDEAPEPTVGDEREAIQAVPAAPLPEVGSLWLRPATGEITRVTGSVPGAVGYRSWNHQGERVVVAGRSPADLFYSGLTPIRDGCTCHTGQPHHSPCCPSQWCRFDLAALE